MMDIVIDKQVIEDIELFVFDKDGTIIDLYHYWYHMIELRAKKICLFYHLDEDTHKENLMFEMGVDCARERLRPDGPVGILPRSVVQKAAEDYMIKLGYEKVSSVCFQVFQEVDQESSFLLDKFIRPIPGAGELLKQIKDKNCCSAIATTDKTERAWLAVKFLKFDGLVSFVIGEDKVNHSKPAPDMLDSIIKETGIPRNKSVMIGDAKTDVQMGINAKFRASIAVCSGLTSRDVLSTLTPYVVEDVSQIKICR